MREIPITARVAIQPSVRPLEKRFLRRAGKTPDKTRAWRNAHRYRIAQLQAKRAASVRLFDRLTTRLPVAVPGGSE